MCGRFIVSYTYDDLLRFISSTFDIFDLDPSIDVPRYNFAPGTNVVSIINDGSKYRAGTLKWGFIPSYSNERSNGYKMINARIESVHIKNSFKKSFKHNRCLILADGYYEWKKMGKTKTPYLISKQSKEMFFFAGLYSKHVDENDVVTFTTTIITKQARTDISDIHDRMPVILDEKHAKDWLNIDTQDELTLLNILNSENNFEFSKTRVSEYVNNVLNDSVECTQEFTENTLFNNA